MRVLTTQIKDHWTKPSQIATLAFGNSGALNTRSFKGNLPRAKRLLEEQRIGVVVYKFKGARISAIRLATPEDKPSSEEELLRCKRRLAGTMGSFTRKATAMRALELLSAAEIREIAPVAQIKAVEQRLLGDGS